MRQGIRNALIVAGVLLLAGLLLFVAWGLTPLGPAPEALAAMESNQVVTVRDRGDYVSFAPAGMTPITGFIFYPGGHVDYRSYAPVAQRIAARGYLVAIVRMPLSLAV